MPSSEPPRLETKLQISIKEEHAFRRTTYRALEVCKPENQRIDDHPVEEPGNDHGKEVMEDLMGDFPIMQTEPNEGHPKLIRKSYILGK